MPEGDALIRSMTGFGHASRTEDGISYALELRSVNNRYFKATIRLPDELAVLEPELEAQLRKHIRRGSLTLSATFKDPGATAAHEINEAALNHYLAHLETVERKAVRDLGSAGGVTIDLGSLLALPGIVQPPDQTELLQRTRPVLLSLVDEACERMQEMRAAEGQGLGEDLRKHCRTVADRLARIEQRAPAVVEEYHERLKQRVEELVRRAELHVEEEALLREVAIFAERSDISEELQRLRAHLDQFEQTLTGGEGEAVGRTLDFITQEMLREANTIASKCNDATISRTIVEIKGSIDRLKEQVQNVE